MNAFVRSVVASLAQQSRPPSTPGDQLWMRCGWVALLSGGQEGRVDDGVTNDDEDVDTSEARVCVCVFVFVQCC